MGADADAHKDSDDAHTDSLFSPYPRKCQIIKERGPFEVSFFFLVSKLTFLRRSAKDHNGRRGHGVLFYHQSTVDEVGQRGEV